MDSLSKQLLARMADLEFSINFRETGGVSRNAKIKSIDWGRGVLSYLSLTYNNMQEISLDDIAQFEGYKVGSVADPSYVPAAAMHGGGVDTLSGNFAQTIPLASLSANAGQGPVVTLALSHCPSKAAAIGNWAPCFSHARVVITSAGIVCNLYTSDGIFSDIVSVDSSLDPRTQAEIGGGLSNFGMAVFPVAESSVFEGFKLVRKDGSVEILMPWAGSYFSVDTSHVRGYFTLEYFLLPTEIISPEGRSVRLEWGSKEYARPFLVSITDESRTLVKAIDPADGTTGGFEVLPGTPWACTHRFSYKDNRLQMITSTAGELVTTQTFRYESSGGLDCITEMANATVVTKDNAKQIVEGVKTTLSYKDGRVQAMSVQAGPSGAVYNTSYTYERGATGQITTVTVGSELTRHHYSLEGQLLKTVVTDGPCSRASVYSSVYDEKTGRRTLTTTTTIAKGSAQRVEVSECVMDAYGNLIKQTERGVTTEWTYYRGEPKITDTVTGTRTTSDVSGIHGVFGAIIDYANPIGWGMQLFGKQGLTWGTIEDRVVKRQPWPTTGGDIRFDIPVSIECAGNPNYATVHVESEKVYTIENGKRTDLRWTFYGYSPFAVAGAYARGPWIKPSVKLTIHQPRSVDGVMLAEWLDGTMEVERTEYHTDSRSVAFGRVRTITRHLLDAMGMEVPLSSHKATLDYQLSGSELVTTITTEAPEKIKDGLTQVIKETLTQTTSAVTGQLLRTVDRFGATTEYTYDAAGRLIQQADNRPDAVSSETVTFAYSATPRGWQVTTTLASGEQYRESVDALRRPTDSEYRVNALGAWLLTSRIAYDARGRQGSLTEWDYRLNYTPATGIGTGTVLCEVQQNFSYDSWGQVSKVETVGGSTDYIEQDPITLQVAQWQAAGTYTGPRLTRWLDVQGRVSKAQYAAGAVTLSTSYAYDAFGQISTESPSTGPQKRYSYDKVGRLTAVKIVAAGEDVLTAYSFAYPRHTLEDNASRIALLRPDGTEYELGSRTFDGLGRMTECRVGGRQQTFTYEGRSAIGIGSAVLKNAKDTYRPAVQIQHNRLTGEVTESSSLFLGPYCPTDLSLSSTHSLRGRLLMDTAGGRTNHTYDALGRLSASTSDNVERRLSYDAGGRVATETVTNNLSKHSMTVTYAYDGLDREIERKCALYGFPTLTLRRAYNDTGRLASAEAWQDGKAIRLEKFVYTRDGRLSTYECAGSDKPIDHGGKALDKQIFTYDKVGNITQVQSEFSGGKNTATYKYDAKDAMQLRSVTHSSPDYPSVSLQYDVLGRLSEDNTHKYYYDDWGGLAEAKPKDGGAYRQFYDYFYDDAGRLIGKSNSTDVIERHQYSGSRLRAVYAMFPSGGAYWQRQLWMGNESDACICQISSWTSIGTAYPITTSSFDIKDAQGSLVARYDLTGSALSHFSYTPYGYRPAGDFTNWIGFNGETVDHFFCDYHLGGYRVYDPALGCFQMPDSLSPFDLGGPNGYAYCSGDPINFSDPTGHMEVLRRYSVMSHKPYTYDPVFRAAMVGTVGVLLAPFTGGESLSLTAASVGLAVASAGFGIAAAALETRNPHLAAGFEWASLGTDLAGGGIELAGSIPGLARLATSTGGAASTARLTRASSLGGNASTAAANVARAGGPVRMGGTMNNLTHIDGDLYTFMDVYKMPKSTNVPPNRLNIAVHGEDLNLLERLVNSSNEAVITVNNNPIALSAKKLLALLQVKGVNPASYDYVRLLICYGGSGGGSSFAAQFQALIGKPVKAYKNAIWMDHGSTAMAKLFAATTNKVTLASTYAASESLKVFKTNPYDLWKDPKGFGKFVLNPYEPVYFR